MRFSVFPPKPRQTQLQQQPWKRGMRKYAIYWVFEPGPTAYIVYLLTAHLTRDLLAVAATASYTV